MTDIERLEHMIDELRRLRNAGEPKSNQNPRYLRYSNAVSNALWIIGDLRAEKAQKTERAICGKELRPAVSATQPAYGGLMADVLHHTYLPFTADQLRERPKGIDRWS